VSAPAKRKPLVAPITPTSEEAAPVLALATTWAAACRSAFHAPRWASAFRTATPWSSLDPKQRRRWAAYYRLAARLREWGADPGEFCVAVATHFATYRRGDALRVPNPTQVSGDWGWRIWWEWRTSRFAEGGGSEATVRARTAGGVATRDEQVVREIAHVWQQCRHQGCLEGVSLHWRPEVLWLLRTTEPAARQVLAGMLSGAPEDDDAVAREARTGLARIAASQKLQLWLLKCRREALGAVRWGSLSLTPVRR